MKFCQNCGAELNDAAKFCDKCGSKVASFEEPKKRTTNKRRGSP